MNNKKKNDAWHSYDKTVGKEGHHYHQTLILPKALELLALSPGDALLDLGCGQGVFARKLPTGCCYLGVDHSASLLRAARRYTTHAFVQGDLSHPLLLEKNNFSHAVSILALQNIKNPWNALKTASDHLIEGGKLLIVLNHPCFRIPRQSSWGVDEARKIQYRRIDRYLSPLEIPIQMQPSQKERSEETWSYHYPLTTYSSWLKAAGFAIDQIEEWCSDKKSSGKKAAMENRSRAEIPLFLAIVAIKRTHLRELQADE